MKTIRIAGAQGFYGDSPLGAIQIAMQGEADYLMHDALAELTLSILQKDKIKDPSMGYARDIEVHARTLYPIAFSKGIKIVTNSGGLNPESAAQKVKAILEKSGIKGIKIATITGDDCAARLDEFKEKGLLLENLDSGEPYPAKYPVTHANVYTGAQAVKDALDQGANLILSRSCGRSMFSAGYHGARIRLENRRCNYSGRLGQTGVWHHGRTYSGMRRTSQRWQCLFRMANEL
jgi:hypothetical protein